MFSNCGVIHIEKNKVKEEEIFEISINAGAKDCINLENIFEIITEKEDFYKIKTELEKKNLTINHSSIEWRPLSLIDITKDKSEQLIDVLNALEALDDVKISLLMPIFKIYNNENYRNRSWFERSNNNIRKQ